MKKGIQIDNSLLLKRLKRYEEVTGKTVAATLRRSARQLAVNLARDTQPYGTSASAKKQGEGAIEADLLRIFYIMKPHNIDLFLDFWGKKHTAKWGHKGAKSLGDVTHQVLSPGEMVSWHLSHRLPNTGRTRNIRGKDGMQVKTTTGIRIHDLPGLDVGIVNQSQFDSYLKEVQKRVGFTKAAWASTALQIKADVKDALRGIPAWVKRHATTSPANVIDLSDSNYPRLTLTNQVPWIDRMIKSSQRQKTAQIAREKFYKALGTEIRFALKKAREATA